MTVTKKISCHRNYISLSKLSWLCSKHWADYEISRWEVTIRMIDDIWLNRGTKAQNKLAVLLREYEYIIKYRTLAITVDSRSRNYLTRRDLWLAIDACSFLKGRERAKKIQATYATNLCFVNGSTPNLWKWLEYARAAPLPSLYLCELNATAQDKTIASLRNNKLSREEKWVSCVDRVVVHRAKVLLGVGDAKREEREEGKCLWSGDCIRKHKATTQRVEVQRRLEPET